MVLSFLSNSQGSICDDDWFDSLVATVGGGGGGGGGASHSSFPTESWFR
jgi:hypothetical protein